MMRKLSICWLSVSLSICSLAASQPAAETTEDERREPSRASLLAEARQAKLEHVEAPTRSTVENGLRSFGEATLLMGKVTAERSDLNFKNLEAAYGVGFRFHTSSETVIRIDLAFSREGFIPFVRYTHVF